MCHTSICSLFNLKSLMVCHMYFCYCSAICMSGLRFKFGTDIEHGASLRRDHKWAWPGSLDLIS